MHENPEESDRRNFFFCAEYHLSLCDQVISRRLFQQIYSEQTTFDNVESTLRSDARFSAETEQRNF